jgi:hypothetical protein
VGVQSNDDFGGADEDQRDGKAAMNLRQATIDQRSVNEKDRTVEISFSSETRDVTRYDWELGSSVPEILSHAEGAADLTAVADDRQRPCATTIRIRLSARR